MSEPQIYIKGFSRNTQDEDLKKSFSQFGEIKEVRIIKDYAFIVYRAKEEADLAVKDMNGAYLNDSKIRVEIAGLPKKPRGPQPSDQCRYCGKIGHWKNDCPSYRSDRRRSRRSSSSSSSSSSSDSRKHKKKRKDKKISKKHSKKRSSSSSSSGSESSSGKSQESKDKKKRGSE